MRQLILKRKRTNNPTEGQRAAQTALLAIIKAQPGIARQEAIDKVVIQLQCGISAVTSAILHAKRDGILFVRKKGQFVMFYDAAPRPEVLLSSTGTVKVKDHPVMKSLPRFTTGIAQFVFFAGRA